MAETFSRFDAVDYLHDEADFVAYLDAAIEERDPEAIVMAFQTIARAREAHSPQSASFAITGSAKMHGVSGPVSFTEQQLRTGPTLSDTMRAAEAAGFELAFRPRSKAA